ncbi:MAG TPA: porin family protein [Cytophaga sp.]|jgi:hypothetical protein|nr:porin family protein [Cytophaga sp.]
METIFKKYLLVLFVSINTIIVSNAQISFGLGSTMGIGYLRSSQLKQGGQAIENQNSSIQNLDFKVRASAQIGFQAVFQYRLTHQLCVLATPGFNLFRSTYNNIYITNDQTGPTSFDYTTHKVLSTAKFKSTQLILPIIAKYYIIPDKNYFATAGLRFAYNTNMRMYSEEDSITSTYNSGGLVASNKQDRDYHGIKIDGYKPFQMHFLLGIGTSILTGYRHNLDIELTYAIPLTSSPYYTTDAAYTSNALVNSVYTRDGKTSFENASGKNLDHFRMHQISLTVRYLIYSINK